MRVNLLLFIIVALAAFLRFYGLDWDQGFHLHPDERAIIMFTTSLDFPKTISEFLSPDSPWNPHFFAYGNFPLYLLKIAGLAAGSFDPSFSAYDKINLVGRFMSGIFDIATIFVIFFLGKKLFGKKTGIIASFFYAISVFPIQASHFYAVDIPLTFFIVLTLYQLIRFYEKPSLKNSILVGICFGASLATKISAIPLLAAITAASAIDFLLIIIKQPHKPHIWFPHTPRFLKRLASDGIVITASTVVIFTILQPYAIIEFNTFWRQNMEQSQMTRDAFTFPYTLQYVGKTPYFYELKNIFLWGQGPILATLSFLGVIYAIFLLIMKRLGWWQADPERSRRRSHDSSEVDKNWAQELILIVFFLTYFVVVGKFAVGWMRYMLPLYPLLSLFAAVIAYQMYILYEQKLRAWKLLSIILNSLYEVKLGLFMILLLVWPLSFMHIYTQPNTRVQATDWINKNIPSGSTLAIEHWDDSLPLFGQEKYQMLTLPLYEPDTQEKWAMLNQKLTQTDYIIIASNRLYTPLMRLTDCDKLPPGRCYKETTDYYKKLFDGSLGFKKIAEFSVLPQLSTFNFQLSIDDSSADESFTVYDHPKVMIFKHEK